jgi:hypothetical protein
MEQPELVRILVNFPTDVMDWIRQESRREDRTMTAVILRAVRAQMQAQREKAVR